MAHPQARSARCAIVAVVAMTAGACAGIGDKEPSTTVAVINGYDAGSTVVVYRAKWHAASFDDAIAPGAASRAEDSVPASATTAYAVLAPGWDPSSDVPPTSLVVVRSRAGYAVHLGDALRISIDDASFVGRCDGGEPLSQEEADFVARRVFPDTFASFDYDAATCTASPRGDHAP